MIAYYINNHVLRCSAIAFIACNLNDSSTAAANSGLVYFLRHEDFCLSLLCYIFQSVTLLAYYQPNVFIEHFKLSLRLRERINFTNMYLWIIDSAMLIYNSFNRFLS